MPPKKKAKTSAEDVPADSAEGRGLAEPGGGEGGSGRVTALLVSQNLNMISSLAASLDSVASPHDLAVNMQHLEDSYQKMQLLLQRAHQGGVAQPASASSQRPSSPGGLLSETARRELELQRREEELAQRERELRRREGLLSVQQEQADAVVKVKRERLASSATQAAKLESDLHARAAELAGLKSAAVEQGAQLQAMASKMKEAEQELECSICMERSAATALNPCGHCFCCSEDCASASAAVCPMCSRAIESRTRIFGAKVEPTEGISGEHLGAIAADLARAAAAVGGGGQNGADISRASTYVYKMVPACTCVLCKYHIFTCLCHILWFLHTYVLYACMMIKTYNLDFNPKTPLLSRQDLYSCLPS